MSSSLDIKYEMQAFDRKDRAYYDNFTDEDRKKFSTFLMLKYGANVGGSAELQSYYLMATNDRVNKNFFELGKHPKLQWLACTTVSPEMGYQYHYWLKAKPKDGDNKAIKFITKHFPNLRQNEIELLAKINDKRDLADMARKLGYDDKSIKSEL